MGQGEVWWANLGEPIGSEPGFRRPVLVVQSDSLNCSALATVICVILTSNLRWAAAPGNVPLSARETGLPKDSIANVSAIMTIDKRMLTERIGRIRKPKLELVFSGIDAMLGR